MLRIAFTKQRATLNLSHLTPLTQMQTQHHPSEFLQAGASKQPCEPAFVQGWYRFAHHFASPNFGPRPVKGSEDISLVVVHSISLPPDEFGGEFIEQFFCNALDHNAHPYFKGIEGVKVSSHFLIKRNGKLLQFVSCLDRAWHAGVSNFKGRDNCNDYSIGIELEGAEYGGTFEDIQYETLTSLCSNLINEYPIKNFIGHEHIAPGRKKDPGVGFKWNLFQKSLGLESKYFP